MGMLEGRTALITGAANGIGRATVERFLSEGAAVVGVDRVRDVSERPGLEWVVADVTDEEALSRAVAQAAEPAGLDICIANAGVGMIENFVEGNRQSWMRLFDVNLIGVMLTLQAAARVMIDAGRGGRLIATASISGLRGEAAPSTAYAASKGAVMALMRSLAVELAPHGITANAVAPGQIDTDLNWADVVALSMRAGRAPSDFRSDFLASSVPMGRMGHPSEVAATFAFLASDDAAFITGETVRIDGGELAI